MAQVEERLNIVESALAEFIIQSNRSLHRLEREIQALKQEITNQEAEKKSPGDEAASYSNGSSWITFLDCIGDFDRDILFPMVPEIVSTYFKHEVVDCTFRWKKHQYGNLVLSVGPLAVSESSVFLFKACRTATREALLEFKHDTMARFREFFPEHATLQLVPVFATTEFEDELLQLATEEKIYFLTFTGWSETDILNFEEVKKG